MYFQLGTPIFLSINLNLEKMASYKVIALSMTMGKRKAPAKSGDILTDEMLSQVGVNPAEMVKKGFLEKVNSGKVTKEEILKDITPEDILGDDEALLESIKPKKKKK